MCGIVAYVGPREAYPVILKGLKRLEYRGYDSAGVALLNSGLKVYKKKGKVADLENSLSGKDLHATIGIGHTRCATHGEPNDCKKIVTHRFRYAFHAIAPHADLIGLPSGDERTLSCSVSFSQFAGSCHASNVALHRKYGNGSPNSATLSP